MPCRVRLHAAANCSNGASTPARASADKQEPTPAAAKGVYSKTLSVSTTMGPGLKVDRSSVPMAK